MPKGVTSMDESESLRTVTDSLNLLRARRGTVNPLSPLYWCEVYDAIRGLLKFSRRDDCFAASVSEYLAYRARLEGSLLSLDQVCASIRSRDVCIAGGSSSLALFLDELASCDTVISVDGATTILSRHGILPRVIVSDLDGAWSWLINAAAQGSILAVHVHGDNYPYAVQFLMSNFLPKLIVSHQCPGHGAYSVFIPGFTDGERALGLALLCSPRSITLYGMRTWEKVGHWSKPWLRINTEPWPLKARKLRIAEFIIELFMVYGLKQGARIRRR